MNFYFAIIICTLCLFGSSNFPANVVRHLSNIPRNEVNLKQVIIYEYNVWETIFIWKSERFYFTPGFNSTTRNSRINFFGIEYIIVLHARESLISRALSDAGFILYFWLHKKRLVTALSYFYSRACLRGTRSIEKSLANAGKAWNKFFKLPVRYERVYSRERRNIYSFRK